ncbi:MAG TPA: DUF3667 domain-containing protein [Chryseolinea sp.]|nr:DUF3667 domain-containing protein [Chryseolinea sp.]
MEDLEKTSALGEGGVEAEQAAPAASINEKHYCLNCQTELTDIYCPHCGQKDIPKRQTLGELFTNFISSFWSYESKFFKTCQYLLFKPGFLATEYNAGRRERYFHPARMYVFMSFVFFLLFFSLPEDETTDSGVNIQTTKEDLADIREDLEEVGLDSIYNSVPDSLLLDSLKNSRYWGQFVDPKKNGRFTLYPTDYESVASYDSAQLAKPGKDRDGWFMRKLNSRGIQINQKYKNKSEEFGRDFGQSFMDNFSKVLFYLLPLFALLLKLLYIRRDFYYSEHLVLSIYYYNFFYLAASIMMLINLVPGIGFISTVIGFWIYIYFLFAMKRMYHQGWKKTIFKFVIFSFIFALLMLIGVSINAVVTLMLI